MNIHTIKNLFVLTLLLTTWNANAETTNCTAITYLPYVITTQGVYCFTGHLNTSMTTGNAIDIQTNNVIIDLNGWKLGGLAAGTATQARGILAAQRKNITIRNGTVRGFRLGISLQDFYPYTTSQGHLIEDIRADKNTSIGFSIQGSGNIVRRNQVVDTGSTLSTYATAHGIVLNGPGGRVLDNDVSNTAASSSGEGYGLRLGDANGAVLEGNRIDDVSSDRGDTRGIYIANSDNVLVRGNSITSADYGIYYDPVDQGSTGKYMDNLTDNVTTRFTGGTAVGFNN